MNRYLICSLAILITVSTMAIPLRAANKPRAGKMEKPPWYGRTMSSRDSGRRVSFRW